MSAPDDSEHAGLEGADGKAGDPDLETETDDTRGPDRDETGIVRETPAKIARGLLDDDAP